MLPAVIADGPQPPAVPAISDADLAELWLGRLSANTRRAYSRDMQYLARHIGLASSSETVRFILDGGPGNANRWALSWHASMELAGLTSATIARRLSALRSVVATASACGLASWSITVRSPKVVTYRDTAGPGRQGWHRVRAAAEQRRDPKGLRDYAILRLLHDLGLRRGECVSLDLEHVDLSEAAVWVLGKGRDERERMSLPPETSRALDGWIRVRGFWAGPVFPRLDRPGAVERMTGQSVALATRAMARRAGVTRGTNPHGFRHQAITEALDKTGGDVRKVQRFSRHRNVQTVVNYDDRRRDPSADVACLVAADD